MARGYLSPPHRAATAVSSGAGGRVRHLPCPREDPERAQEQVLQENPAAMSPALGSGGQMVSSSRTPVHTAGQLPGSRQGSAPRAHAESNLTLTIKVKVQAGTMARSLAWQMAPCPRVPGMHLAPWSPGCLWMSRGEGGAEKRSQVSQVLFCTDLGDGGAESQRRLAEASVARVPEVGRQPFLSRVLKVWPLSAHGSLFWQSLWALG